MNRGAMILILVLAAACAVAGSAALAAWQTNGFPVGSYDQPTPEAPLLVPDGAGGAIAVWVDSRYGEKDLYAQRFTAAGDTLWTMHGIPVCAAAGDQENHRVRPDGAGGVLVVWQDLRGGEADVYAQRIDGGGNLSWPAGGVAVCLAGGAQHDLRLVADGSGGAVVAWKDERGADTALYAQRINGSGTAVWTTDGVAVGFSSADDYDYGLTPDGTGGGLLAWNTSDAVTSNIHVRRVDAGGTPRWPAGGVEVCGAAGRQRHPALVSDGLGGAIIAWLDYRSGEYEVYAQRIDIDGAVQWATDGVAICTVAQGRYDCQAVTDGSGGAIIAWEDDRGGHYAQRVDGSGLTQWDVAGVAVGNGTWEETRVVADGSGGVLFAWEVYVGVYDTRSRVQWVDAGGTARWGGSGTDLGTETDYAFAPDIVPDVAGGAFVVWHENYAVTAQRIDATAAVQWAAEGVDLCRGNLSQSSARVVADEAGGAIVAWIDERNFRAEIRAQRYDDLGAALWTTGGVIVCDADGARTGLQVAADGSGGAIFAWSDRRSGEYDIYAQRLDGGGNALWTTGGVLTCGAAHEQETPRLVTDGAGGTIVCWLDRRTGGYDIAAQRIDATGSPVWTAGGVAVCAAANTQYDPAICSDDAGGAIITWHDARSGSSWDVYAQRIGPAGSALWTFGGRAICTAEGDQMYPLLVPDGGGGAFVAWLDGRYTVPRVFVQHTDASGSPSWETDGLMIWTGASARHAEFRIVPGVAGEAIVCWRDNRLVGVDWELYAQKIDLAGELAWDEDAVPVCTAPSSQTYLDMAPDGAGGALVTWCDQRSGLYDPFAQRLDADGNPVWTVDGVLLSTASTLHIETRVVGDGADGARLVWLRQDVGWDVCAQGLDGAICDPQPPNLDFGVVDMLGFRDETFTLINSGDVPLNGAMSLDCPDFSIVAGEGAFTLPAGGSRDVTVRFAPAYLDTQSCVVDFGTTIGAGVPCVGAARGPDCDIVPAAIVLPDPVLVGTHVDTSFTITNTAGGILTGAVSENAEHFEIVAGGGDFVLYHGESRSVTVRFAPTVDGEHSAGVATGSYACSDVSIGATAYLCPPGAVLYVDVDATGAGNGTCWADAFPQLYDALEIAGLCSQVAEIWVAEGTYLPAAGADRSATFGLRDGLAVYGGFAGTETRLDERDFRLHVTTLSGDVGTPGDASDNCWSVVTADGVDTTAVLDGCTITGAKWEDGIDDGGGGMIILDGSPTLSNLRFVGNECVELGGGVFATGASAPSITNTFFLDNSARNGGGMMVAYGATCWLANVVFVGNEAAELGGGLYVRSGDVDLVCASFCDNAAGTAGGALAFDHGDQPELASVILWGDDAHSAPEIFNASTVPRITHSIIQDCGGSGAGWDAALGGDGGGNLEDEPLWMDPPYDLRQQDGSPGIDTGTAWPGLPSVDILGNPRIQNGIIDMGAYEGGVVPIRVLVAADPPGVGLEVVVDGQTWPESRTFYSEEGETHEIGVATPQLIGDRIWSFSHWNDAGDTTHVITVPDQDAHYDAYFTSLYAWAAVDSIVDVPGDQGGWANLHFGRSWYDRAGENEYPVERYDIHRRIDDPERAAGMLAAGTAHTGTKEAPPGVWTVVGNVSAAQQEHYIRLVPTVGDSAATIPWSVYYVSAHTTTPAVFFDSPPDSGYSTDDIAPAVPTGLQRIGPDLLAWDDPVDADFAHFTVYGSATGELDGSEALIAHTNGTSQDLIGHDYAYFLVTASDAAGNESGAAPFDALSGVPGGAVTRYALHRSVPNPFNPRTTIRYELPLASRVHLGIFDIAGRSVRTLVAGETIEAGRHEAVWRGRDDNGRPVAAGVYFYRLQAGDFRETRRMTLVK